MQSAESSVAKEEARMPLVEEAVMADSEFEGQLGGVVLEVPSTVDSEPSSRRIWSIHKWGIASLSRHFRKDPDVEPVDKIEYPKVATATMEEPITADYRFEGQPTGVAVEESRTVDSEPSSRRIWSIHKWGIASLLRHSRRNADVEPAEKMQYPKLVTYTIPAEDSPDCVSGADQRISYPSVRSWPEEGIAEPAVITDSVARPPDEPNVMQWPEEEPQPAVTAWSDVRASEEPATATASLFQPEYYFWWFLLVTVVVAFTVVPVVWIAGTMLA